MRRLAVVILLPLAAWHAQPSVSATNASGKEVADATGGADLMTPGR